MKYLGAGKPALGRSPYVNTESPIDYIEKQLKKIFVSLGSRWAKVSSILSKLDLTSLDIKQRESTYSIDAMLKLYIYKRVKGITTYPNLSADLTKAQDSLIDLGLEKLP